MKKRIPKIKNNMLETSKIEIHRLQPRQTGVDFLAFPPINIGERYKILYDLRKVISQSEILFDLKQLHQLSVSL